jgi:hypothetical protein
MRNPHEPLQPRGGLAERRLKRLAMVMVLAAVSMTGLVAADSCGGGGGGSCQACRDDCERNGIPASQCNCEGCTPP